ncbi:MAG TPA: hypothetical protein PK971_06685 [Saprospiraceae bacterium]|nr:hypothetical protein [Saprospiraceae bacterium]HND87992.1 hypothetical protein [Saprospiraceae bacterium]
MQSRLSLSLLILAFMAFAPAAFGQYNVVQERERNMSFGSRPAFYLEFPNADAGMVEDMWKDFAKKSYGAKLKKDKKSGEWNATELKASLMGGDPFAVYSLVEKTSRGASLSVWYDAGAYFLNRRDNSSRAEEASRSLRTFYYDVRRATIAKELKAEEEKLKDLEKQQKSLQKDNDGLRKDIENWKAKIKKAEEDIVKNERDQEANIKEQEAQRTAIQSVQERMKNVENENN